MYCGRPVSVQQNTGAITESADSAMQGPADPGAHTRCLKIESYHHFINGACPHSLFCGMEQNHWQNIHPIQLKEEPKYLIFLKNIWQLCLLQVRQIFYSSSKGT